MKKFAPLFWIAGLVTFAVLASLLSRVIGAAVDGPPLLFAIIFAVLAIVGVFVFALVKKFSKRWIWVGATAASALVVFIYVAVWTQGSDYYNGYIAGGDTLYDDSGSALIEGYDDYYLVELYGDDYIIAAHSPKVDDNYYDCKVVEGDVYELNGKRVDDFTAVFDVNESLRTYFMDKDVKFHKF